MAKTPERLPGRALLTDFLQDFVRARRGLRSGAMFGMPAVYAGRRLVACVSEDGLISRLTKDDVRGQKVSVRPLVVNGRESKGWTVVRPRSAAFHGLAPLLERAAVRAATAPLSKVRRTRGIR